MIPPVPLSRLQGRRPSLVETTCERLAAHVAEEYPGENRLPAEEIWLPSERELASRFHVSRPVIREATKRLEFQGLLEIHHGRGTKLVRQLQRPLSSALRFDIPDNLERLRQLNETRRILEPEIARLAASHASDADLKTLSTCHDDLVSCREIEAAARIDARFHELIARAAGNRVVALVLAAFGDLAEESRRRTLNVSGLETAVAHHGAILEALKNRAGDEAARLMAYHVGEASRDLEASERAASAA